MNLKLSAPKEITWIIAVVAGVIGLLIKYGNMNIAGLDAVLMLAIGFVILAIATVTKGI